MLSFAAYLIEYPIEYFEAMPDIDPPDKVAAAQKRFGLDGVIQWKVLTNRSIHQSEELDNDVIIMKPNDDRENWFHELGHKVYDKANHKDIDPLLDRIRNAYRVHNKDLGKEFHSTYKQIELGGYYYAFSHSGIEYEHDELFAVSFAFVMMGGKFKDADIQKDYMEMLEKLSVVE